MSRVHRHALSKSEAKEVSSRIGREFKLERELDYKAKWEVLQLSRDLAVYVVDELPVAIEVEGRLIPSLRAVSERIIVLPKVVVDMGAVKHIANGADVMAPGVTRIEGDFDRGDIVAVVDERYGKPLCVGSALASREDVEKAERGKVVENIHHVGDKIWVKLKEVGLV